MKYVDEYRNAEQVKQLAAMIRRQTTRPWNLMEVCGGQTNAIIRFGLDRLLPPEIRLIHGPGCPVCVTPIEMIDQAVAIASLSEVIFCSFGDMLRVPGSEKDLLTVKSEGADVRIVYSPMDAVALATANPDRDVVFFAIGFETTAPAVAMAIAQADRLGLDNFSALVSHVLVPPAICAVLDSPDNIVQGFLAAGHVCAVMGTWQYEPIARQYGVPIVVTGFEPLDILQGVALCIDQLENGRGEVAIQYTRCVQPEGNSVALAQIDKVFRTVPRKWRGIGEIPESGWALRHDFSRFDAAARFGVEGIRADEPAICLAGAVLQGHKRPFECPAFGRECTPETPVGAPMVSSEGACSAYYRYRLHELKQADGKQDSREGEP
ncbi:MAG TPA: hydrogenase formation protein HypD [Planctomycetaceae bacterium]|nr:hydrogenase formation protein HypD [Planctomycetaceae bacterium]